MKIALRNLRRGGIYSVINIGGLAIGMAATILIMLWVHNELSYDSYHPDSKRIYRITNTLNNLNWVWEGSPYLLADAIDKEMPEVEEVALLQPQLEVVGIKINDQVFPAKDVAYVDSRWFEMFHYDVREGSVAPFGGNPFSLVITESEAVKYFGKLSAVGKEVMIGNTVYTIQAVIRDNPANSSFRFSVLMPIEAALSEPSERENAKQWWNYNYQIFVKLRNEAEIASVCGKINNIYESHEAQTEATLRALADIHFETDIQASSIPHGNSKMISLFSILAILLLSTACINYVNLTTAKSNMRAKEVGIKKITGAKRPALMMQFIGESFLVSLIAIICAVFLVWAVFSPYTRLVGDVVWSATSPVIWLIFGGTLIITTLLNGIYPAIMLSSFNPLNAIKGKGLAGMKDSNLRKGLVVLQFAMSAGLIIGVMVIFRQMQYIRNTNSGYDREQVVSFSIPYKILWTLEAKGWESTMQSIKNELTANPNISGVALTNQSIVDIRISMSGNLDWDGRDKEFRPSVSYISADLDYLKVMGLTMVDGRWFEPGEADKINMILNETAVRELGLREPYIGQRLSFNQKEGKLVGIVRDFHFKSLHEKIGPVMISNMDYCNTVVIKTLPGKSVQVVKAAEHVWKSFFPNEPFEYSFMDDTFNNLYRSDIKTSQMMLIFSLLTVFLAMLGLFGLSAFAVERRTKEIGIRKILGASVSTIVNLLSRDFLALVGIAFVLGTPVAWWLMNGWLDNFAYRTNIPWWIFAATAILTIGFALFTVSWQAIKAARSNPVKSITTE